MKKILILIITLSSLALNAQVKTYKDQNTGDKVNRFVVNTNEDGESNLGLITGTDTVWISGYNSNINISADTVRINGKVYIGTGSTFDAGDIKDTLDVHREEITALSDTWTSTGNYVYPKTITDSIGIGMSEPRSILDVAGRITITNTGGSVFIGEGAGKSDNLNNNGNVFIGKDVGSSNVSGQYNVGIGRQSNNYSTTGSNNISIGLFSLYNNLSGSYNAAIGVGAMGADEVKRRLGEKCLVIEKPISTKHFSNQIKAL